MSEARGEGLSSYVILAIVVVLVAAAAFFAGKSGAPTETVTMTKVETVRVTETSPPEIVTVTETVTETQAIAAPREKPQTLKDYVREWLGSMLYASSLHATTRGMGYWYEQGFYKIAGIPYEKMGCKECHATCETCHVEEKSPGTYDFSVERAEDMKGNCLKCHGREGFGMKIIQTMIGTDAHFSKNMTCLDCHTSSEIHGLKFKEDGTPFVSYREPGFFETGCEDCHLTGREVPGVGVAPKPSSNIPEHQIHWYTMKNVHCTACHVATVQTCYSCHFDGALQGVPHSRLFTPLVGWVFLVKYNGMVYSANIMSITYEGKDSTFLIWAPFFSHIVVKEGRKCNECHGSPVVKDIMEDRKIVLTWWNETANRLEWLHSSPSKGIIVPVVEGVEYKFTFVKKVDFATGTIAPFKTASYIPSTLPLPELGYATMIAYSKPLSWEELEKLG